jgi:hypothetical protein
MIFAAPDRVSAEAIIDGYSSYWMQIVGTRGFKGKKTMNARTQFNALFDLSEPEVEDDGCEFDFDAMDQLQKEQL